jgi:tellurite resistance protein TerC
MESLLGGHSLAAWASFNVMILAFLAIDLGVFNRSPRVLSVRESIFWNVLWTGLGLLFALLVGRLYGQTASIEYVTGYVLERALSIDNIFVFVVVFRYFAVPAALQHRVLYWGILGALIMRGALILAGAAAVARFHWLLYVFGAFLVYTGIQLVVKEDEPPHPERNPVVRLAGRLFPVIPRLEGRHFFIRVQGRLHATPLFLVLLVLETTDLLFAFDSIPAIFGVTTDPFIIYTSNVFAILGLRAMYFLIAALLPSFRYLKYGLALVLVFIGFRMLAEPWYRVDVGTALGVVAGILAVAVAASLIPRQRPPG